MLPISDLELSSPFDRRDNALLSPHSCISDSRGF